MNAMGTETDRARELLESSERLLEECRNRPRYSSSFLDAQPERRAVERPIVRKVQAHALIERTAPTMDGATQARWDAWAKSLARKECLALVNEIGPTIADALEARDKAIAVLERRIEQLEAQAKVRSIRSAA